MKQKWVVSINTDIINILELWRLRKYENVLYGESIHQKITNNNPRAYIPQTCVVVLLLLLLFREDDRAW